MQDAAAMERKWLLARNLRNRPTEAERRLWYFLRRGGLEGWKFRRQYPIAGFIVDFVCIPARLVVEVDGGQHAERFAEDARRSRVLAAAGYQVLRFWNDQVMREPLAVCDVILRQLPAPMQGHLPG